jgi:hypothetical protein
MIVQVIPGAGTKWTHLHRSPPWGDAPPPDGHAYEGAVAVEDDLHELPWPIIFLGEKSSVDEYREREERHHSNVREAIAGAHLPDSAPCREPQPGGGCPDEEAPLGCPGLDDAGEAVHSADTPCPAMETPARVKLR